MIESNYYLYTSFFVARTWPFSFLQLKANSYMLQMACNTGRCSCYSVVAPQRVPLPTSKRVHVLVIDHLNLSYVHKYHINNPIVRP